MKKIISNLLLGAVLVSGIFFIIQPDAEDTAFGGERHPPVVGDITSID